MIYRFEMSGQRFEFDDDHALFTFDEMFVVEDVFGVKIDDFMVQVTKIGGGVDASSALRTVGVMAFLAYRRAGGDLGWPAFSKTIAPTTLRVIPDEPVPAPAPPPVVSPTAAAIEAEPNIFDVPAPPA